MEKRKTTDDAARRTGEALEFFECHVEEVPRQLVYTSPDRRVRLVVGIDDGQGFFAVDGVLKATYVAVTVQLLYKYLADALTAWRTLLPAEGE